jgi:hypothetical protein
MLRPQWIHFAEYFIAVFLCVSNKCYGFDRHNFRNILHGNVRALLEYSIVNVANPSLMHDILDINRLGHPIQSLYFLWKYKDFSLTLLDEK